jgi:hypothetical protein
MRYGSCYLSERRYVKHVPVTGARAARSPGHVRFNVGQKILRRSLVCAPDTDCPLWAGRARPEPHRTARQPVVGPSAEPAICALSACADSSDGCVLEDWTSSVRAGRRGAGLNAGRSLGPHARRCRGSSWRSRGRGVR